MAVYAFTDKFPMQTMRLTVTGVVMKRNEGYKTVIIIIVIRKYRGSNEHS